MPQIDHYWLTLRWNNHETKLKVYGGDHYCECLLNTFFLYLGGQLVLYANDIHILPKNIFGVKKCPLSCVNKLFDGVLMEVLVDNYSTTIGIFFIKYINMVWQYFENHLFNDNHIVSCTISFNWNTFRNLAYTKGGGNHFRKIKIIKLEKPHDKNLNVKEPSLCR